MGISIFFIALISLLVYGYYRAKTGKVILLDDSLKTQDSICITDPYKGLRDIPIFLTNGTMTPKQYGYQFANGKSRVKKTNRLKFRK